MACFYLFDIYRWINNVRGEGWYASRGTTCGTTTTAATDKSGSMLCKCGGVWSGYRELCHWQGHWWRSSRKARQLIINVKSGRCARSEWRAVVSNHRQNPFNLFTPDDKRRCVLCIVVRFFTTKPSKPWNVCNANWKCRFTVSVVLEFRSGLSLSRDNACVHTTAVNRPT